MSVTQIVFEIDTDHLAGVTDEYLTQCWHIAQANPASYGDATACDLAETIGREVIRRWLVQQPTPLWHHQAKHMLPFAGGRV
ncbi:MAG: hypothetical protein KAY82_05160 [Hylemonella sp.]|nr:hypothetical protein [Hylemonella sp.]